MYDDLCTYSFFTSETFEIESSIHKLMTHYASPSHDRIDVFCPKIYPTFPPLCKKHRPLFPSIPIVPKRIHPLIFDKNM